MIHIRYASLCLKYLRLITLTVLGQVVTAVQTTITSIYRHASHHVY